MKINVPFRPKFPTKTATKMGPTAKPALPPKENILMLLALFLAFEA